MLGSARFALTFDLKKSEQRCGVLCYSWSNKRLLLRLNRELAPKAAVHQRPSLAQGRVVLKYAKVGRLSVDLVVSCH